LNDSVKNKIEKVEKENQELQARPVMTRKKMMGEIADSIN
jgi:hypothetical protein